MSPLRAFVAGMKQESNTFVPFRCGLDDFRAGLYFVEGPALEATFAGRQLEISGICDALRPAGWEIVPGVAGEAVPSGPVEDAALAWFLGQWQEALRAAGRVDAVLLALHGAMVAEHSDDACGDILAAIRRQVGPDVFVGATYDLHANITRRMLRHADALIGFHTYPHVDQYEVGLRLGRLARRWAAEGLRPAQAVCKVPMLVSPGMQSTAQGPFAELMRQAIALEAQPGVLSASLFPVQPWLDVPELGFAALVVTEGDADQAQREADALGRSAWARRHAFALDALPAEAAIRAALATEGGPVVIADLGDGPGGGAGGDSTALLRAMLAQDAGAAGPALLSLTDAPAVGAAQAAGVGATIRVVVGDTVSRGFFEPTPVAGRVAYLGRPSYRAYKGETTMGPTAVLDVAGVFLLLTEKPILTVTPDPYEAAGLDPRRCKMVVAKSGAQFRETFEPFARRILFANTPGPTSSDFPTLPFRRLARPMYPWDDGEWQP